MTKEIAKLSARRMATEKRPGMHADGGGLYLQVTPTGARTWLLRYQLAGRRREMGLGSASAGPDGKPVVSLADARLKAADAMRLVAAGIDPIADRDAKRAAAVVEAAKTMTFRASAEAFLTSMRAGWRNAKHAAQWDSTLETYVHPTLGDLPVRSIDAALILKVLNPIWRTKPETASRVRGRVEAILDHAKAQGGREGDNPARWSGNLQYMLPSLRDVRLVRHHASMPYGDMPTFWPRLQIADGQGARALEFLILTAGRTGEVLNAQWPEIDDGARVWTVPPERMKGKKEHRVPLTDPALALLRKLAAARTGDLIFPGQSEGMPLSNMTMQAVLRRLRVRGTPHGFRSSFRTWVAEETSFPADVAEAALAHTQGKLHAAYQRGDLLEKRRTMMDAWANYVEGRGADVVPLRRPG
ncbi:MAG TPA: integrase arm-type DNA-binding domain-containing protein [Vineibacter sp.]|nr:integrase arm-type DNA-binding domain-containing protein [Vineibacter sp.]